MNNKYRLVVLIVIALSLVVVSLVGCKKEEDSSSVGVITDVKIATAVDSSDRPIRPATVFPADTKAFYCSFKTSHFPPGSKIMVEWIYVTGEAVAEVGESNIFQVNTGTLDGDGYTSIALQIPPENPDYKWPKGEFKVVLSVNGEEKANAPFKVE